MNDEKYPESILVTVWGTSLELFLADMIQDARLKTESKFRQYRRYSKESLESQLESFVKAGNRILAQFRGVKGSKERELRKFLDHPIYRLKDNESYEAYAPRRAQGAERFEMIQGARYNQRLKNLEQQRLDNAIEKSIIRYVLKEKEVEVQ